MVIVGSVVFPNENQISLNCGASRIKSPSIMKTIHTNMKPIHLHLLGAGLALAASLSAATADYQSFVVGQGPKAYYRLNEAGPLVARAVNLGTAGAAANGYYEPLVKLGQPGALAGSTDTAVSFSGGVAPGTTGGAIGAVTKVVVP